MSRPRVLVVTNFASHYRAPLFELMHERLGAEFLFFSKGGEEYWQPHLGVTAGRFPGLTVASGPSIGKVRFNRRLWTEMMQRDFDVVIKCMNGRVELPMAYVAARRKDAAFVLWTGMWMHPQTAFHTASRPLTRWIYRHADSVVTYGDHVSRFVVTEGASEAGVFSADNATDNALYMRDVSLAEVADIRRRYELGESRVVLAVARLVGQKGLDILLEAVGGLESPRPVVLVVGTGSLEDELIARARSLGVQLRLVGGHQPAEMPPFYAAADVFVMPSLTTRTFKEPWGLACNEAMCQGVPVVATDAVGAAAGGLVVDGETGFVVPERDAAALRIALARVLEDDGLARRLGESGKSRVQRVDYSNMVDGFERALTYAFAQRGER